jgi:S-adenosylmethionine hydrolase
MGTRGTSRASATRKVERGRPARAAAAAASSQHGAAPVVTLTTDFGLVDPFVGIMKGVILGIAPSVRTVDVTHGVPAQNVVAGAYALASAVRWFPRGSVHVAVVDPGVGTRRRALLVETTDGWLVGPDNGLLSLAAPARGVRRIFDVSRSAVRLKPVSRTFHGRDVFAPVAAALAAGVAPERLGQPLRSMTRLRPPGPRRRGTTLVGEVLWVDVFGNLTTNVTAGDLARAFRGGRLSITIAGHVVPFRSSYAGEPAGRPVAVVNSSDLVEVAVNGGSAAARFDAGPGAPIEIRRG